MPLGGWRPTQPAAQRDISAVLGPVLLATPDDLAGCSRV